MSRRVTPRHRAAPPPASSSGRLIRRIPVLVAVIAFICLTAGIAAALSTQHHHASATSPQELLGRAESQFDAGSFASHEVDGGGSRAGTGATIPRSAGARAPGSADAAATPTTGVPGTGTSPAPGPTTPRSAASAKVPAAPPATSTAAAVAAPAKPASPPTINISSNIPFSVNPNNSACSSDPTGATCTNDAIATLNHAHAVLGIANYNLPGNFGSMTAAQQLLTLSNLDRAVFGLQQIAGLNSTLNSAAQQGVTDGGDPVGVNVGSVQWQSWGSNWASGYPNAAYTYYAWMFDDGPGSANGDCTSSNTSGCWGHRLNTLHNFGSGVQVGMGVGASGRTFTELYESFAAAASIPYS